MNSIAHLDQFIGRIIAMPRQYLIYHRDEFFSGHRTFINEMAHIVHRNGASQETVVKCDFGGQLL
jgi:hypothetical protein